MSRSSSSGGLRAAGLALTAFLALAPTAGAQSGGPGFLFKRPIGSLTLRGGVDRALGNSDLFDFVRDELTLERGDFTGLNYGADLAITLSNQVDVVLGASHARSTARSEFRRFVDNDDRPIEQTTALSRTPIAGSVKAYLTPRGQTLGRFAWLPTRLAPFVGAGGGAMYYRFRQDGDFVRDDLSVRPDELTTSGWTPTAHGFAGLDLSLSPRVAVTGEARYNWARANTTGDFQDYQIDLSGLGATVGLTFRF
jgi:hypothetical protein